MRVFDAAGAEVEREVHVSDVSLASLELGPYRHFMQKEIHEQPRAIADTIEAVIDGNGFSPELFGADADAVLRDVEGVQILACGTSYYAGLIARYWIEAIAGLPCAVEIASEYRYRTAVANPKHLIVTISQSGETAGHDGGAEVRQVARPRAHAVDLQRARERDPARQPSWCSTPAPAPRSAWPRPRPSPPSWSRCSR